MIDKGFLDCAETYASVIEIRISLKYIDLWLTSPLMIQTQHKFIFVQSERAIFNT